MSRPTLKQVYDSQSALTATSLWDWRHVAVTDDGDWGKVVQFFDSEVMGREVSPLHAAGRPIRFGPAEIGNWGLPTPGHRDPLRSLTNAADEVAIYSNVLNADEVKALCEAGRIE